MLRARYGETHLDFDLHDCPYVTFQGVHRNTKENCRKLVQMSGGKGMHTSKGDYIDPDCENGIPGKTLARTVWRETVLEGMAGNIANKLFWETMLLLWHLLHLDYQALFIPGSFCEEVPC
jgi:hypothetical protein